MSKNLRKLGRSAGIVVAFFVVFEGFVFLRWTFFRGPEPSLRDLDTGLGILICLWAVTKIGGWFERREARDKEIAARIRDIDSRLEALYKWGNIPLDDKEEVHERLLEDDEDLDEGTRANIAKYKACAVRGHARQQNNLAITYSNLHTTSGYKKAVYWFHKAQEQGQESEHSLAETYRDLHDYNKAMLWYRKAVQRSGSLVYLAEDNIGDMYAEGQGVSQNHAEAARWWSRAAQHGCKPSHYALGKLYADGAEGVEQNTSEAYFHLYIASSAKNYPNPYATELRDKVAKKLGEYAVARERKRAEEWLARKNESARQETKSKVKPLPLPD